MARAYSDDLRERVAAAVLSGRTTREVAASFDVSVASAVRWSGRLRDTGSAAARPTGGNKRRVLEGEQQWMLLRLEECPDLTVRGLALELAERGIKVSPNTVWSMLHKAGYSFKKKSVRHRAGSAQGRPAARAVEEISQDDLIRPGSSLSTKFGPKPIWPRCGAGHPEVNDFMPRHHSENGVHSPSWPPCVMTGSMRLAYWMAP